MAPNACPCHRGLSITKKAFCVARRSMASAPIRRHEDTCTNRDTSRIIYAHDAFPTLPAPNLNPTAPRTGITTDHRLKEMIWVQTMSN